MYANKFAVALKSADGRILREFNGDNVYIPFGGEYSVYMKNMHGRRAIAQISIDGVDVGDGLTFVVPAHGTLELERFVKNGNLHEGNRFKFIERTAGVAQHRGVDIEDGLVRVTFQLEKEIVRWIEPTVCRNRTARRTRPHYGTTTKSFNSNIGGSRGSFDSYSVDTSYEGTIGDDSLGIASAAPENEVGVTAPGSVSDQSFTMSAQFPLEAEKTTVVLQILGETEENREIVRPVTVRARSRCVSCGTLNKAGAKFCAECGTSLQIV